MNNVLTAAVPAVQLLAAALLPGAAQARPYVPSRDDEVVERLPARPDPTAQATRASLARDPRQWPLDLGVEAGQMLLVVVLLPLALAARRAAAYRRWIVRPVSAVVAVLATAWTLERALALPLLSR